jgi:hypothetical protein
MKRSLRFKREVESVSFPYLDIYSKETAEKRKINDNHQVLSAQTLCLDQPHPTLINLSVLFGWTSKPQYIIVIITNIYI